MNGTIKVLIFLTTNSPNDFLSLKNMPDMKKNSGIRKGLCAHCGRTPGRKSLKWYMTTQRMENPLMASMYSIRRVVEIFDSLMRSNGFDPKPIRAGQPGATIFLFAKFLLEISSVNSTARYP